MALFRYKASTIDQDSVFGEIRAESAERAISKLSSLGFFDVSLEEYPDDQEEVSSPTTFTSP
jgi:type II secretory pathway component PulF